MIAFAHRLRRILHLKIKIPWLKVVVSPLGTAPLKETEHLFYRSALIIGPKSDCDLKVESDSDDCFVIERRGERYFLSKAVRPAPLEDNPDTRISFQEPVELIDGDIVELEKAKLKISLGSISISFCRAAVAVAVISVLLFVLGFLRPASDMPMQTYNCGDLHEGDLSGQDRPVKISREQNSSAEPSDGPKKGAARKVPISPGNSSNEERNNISVDELAERLCLEDPFMDPLCREARELIKYFNMGKKALVRGEILEAKGAMLRAERSIKSIPVDLARSAKEEISSSLAEIFSYEAEQAQKREDLESAREAAAAALAYRPDDPASKAILEKLSASAKRLFIESYLLEESDKQKAREGYSKILKIVPELDDYHAKAKARLLLIDGPAAGPR